MQIFDYLTDEKSNAAVSTSIKKTISLQQNVNVLSQYHQTC